MFDCGKWQWKLSYRRRLFDWEVAIHNEFLNCINGIAPSVGNNDSLVWCLNQKGTYSVKEACKWVEEQVFEKDWQIPNQISKLIPPKIGLFVWQAQSNKIASKKANLIARGVELQGHYKFVSAIR